LTFEADDGMDYYIWNTGDESQYLIVWDTGVYWVEVLKDGCSASDSVTVYNIPANVQFPTAFSPNGDGVNDLFLPRVTGVISMYRIEIYNRYGQQVWRNSDVNEGWNGEFDGRKCPSENYVWIVKYNIVKGETLKTVEKSGNVILIR
jgi:gliding motility-associated-like protein